ncbi:hypothetical protein [Marinicrinis sediminis]|uniref:Uncharacterized protein n=1 Tax=Marinicrinis sediminis TaxID=1652465 RepID=A0ABW5R935_9BACL
MSIHKQPEHKASVVSQAGKQGLHHSRTGGHHDQEMSAVAAPALGMHAAKANVLSMQRAVGNQAIQHMLRTSAHTHPHVSLRSVVQRQPNERTADDTDAVLPEDEVGEANLYAAAAREEADEGLPEDGPAEVNLAAAAAREARGSGDELPEDGPAERNLAAAAEREDAPPSNRTVLHELGFGAYYDWLKYKANKQEKTDLFSFFDKLSPAEQVEAIKLMAGSDAPDFSKFTDNMSTRSKLVKRVNWDKFSEDCRKAKSMRTENYNEDGYMDQAYYAGVGASAGAAAAKGTANAIGQAGDSGATSFVSHVAPGAAALGAVASGLQVANGVRGVMEEGVGSYDTMHQVAEIDAGLADMTRSTAQSVETGRALAGKTAASAATTVAGVAGVVGGAYYLADGVAGTAIHHGRKQALEGIAERAGSDGQLETAARLGADTQTLNRNKSAATAVKGAGMIVGGALLLAGSGPIGWILLGAAGVVGGAAAVYKFWKKRSRKEGVVERYLDVENHMQQQGLDDKNKEQRKQVRESLMQQNGFNSVAQCYNHIVTDLAHAIYEKGVRGDDAEYMSLIENIGLERNAEQQQPKPEMIAKKLHT